MLKKTLHALGRSYIARICRDEYEQQTFKRLNERPVEFRFVFERLTELTGQARSVIDVGTGTTALPDLMRTCGFVVTASDNVRDYWPEGMVNRHYHVVDDDITRTSLKPDSFDVVTCISVLEHIKEHEAAVGSMIRVLKPGGHLILTCPYNEGEYAPDCYTLPGSMIGPGVLPYVCQSYSRKELNAWLRSTGAILAAQEFWHLWTGRLWTCGERIHPARQTSAAEPHQLTCLLLRKAG